MYRTLEELLLQLSLCDLNLDGLVDLLLVTALVIGIVLNSCREQGVDEGRLSQAGLTSNLAKTHIVRRLDRARAVRMLVCSRSTYHDGESSTALGDNLVPLVRQMGNAHRASGFGDLGGHDDVELRVVCLVCGIATPVFVVLEQERSKVNWFRRRPQLATG